MQAFFLNARLNGSGFIITLNLFLYFTRASLTPSPPEIDRWNKRFFADRLKFPLRRLYTILSQWQNLIEFFKVASIPIDNNWK